MRQHLAGMGKEVAEQLEFLGREPQPPHLTVAAITIDTAGSRRVLVALVAPSASGRVSDCRIRYDQQVLRIVLSTGSYTPAHTVGAHSPIGGGCQTARR